MDVGHSATLVHFGTQKYLELIGHCSHLPLAQLPFGHIVWTVRVLAGIMLNKTLENIDFCRTLARNPQKHWLLLFIIAAVCFV